jgi:periplasmic divalent cation tolerance protein
MGRRRAISGADEQSLILTPSCKDAEDAKIFIISLRLRFYALKFIQMIVVLTTAPNMEEAETLARKIVEARLAACVQVLPPMKSFYFWEGAVQAEAEQLLLIKTRAAKFDELEAFIKSNHSYAVPEITALRAEKVSADYFEWLAAYVD